MEVEFGARGPGLWSMGRTDPREAPAYLVGVRRQTVSERAGRFVAEAPVRFLF